MKIKINTWMHKNGSVVQHKAHDDDLYAISEYWQLIETREIELPKEKKEEKRREFWIRIYETSTPYIGAAYKTNHHANADDAGSVHVTELRDGEKIVSRDDVMNAWPYLPVDTRESELNILLRNLGFSGEKDGW